MTKRPWTTKELARMHELRASGMTHAQIAKELDRTTHAVKNMFERTK